MAQGRRTVAAALRASGNAQASNWSLFHQVLNRARWSPLAVSRQLLLLIVETLVPAGACVDLVIDETLERRWGSQISKRGHYRDSALSSKKRSVSSPGLRWIAMAVVVTLPWTKQRWALSFLCMLATTPEVSEHLGKRHKTIGMWAHQMVSLVRRWLPGRSIKLLGDTAYTVLELGLHANDQQVTDDSRRAGWMPSCMSHRPRGLSIPLAVLVSLVSVCLLWKACSKTPKLPGRSWR